MKGLLILLQSVTVENRSTESKKEKEFQLSLGHFKSMWFDFSCHCDVTNAVHYASLCLTLTPFKPVS